MTTVLFFLEEKRRVLRDIRRYVVLNIEKLSTADQAKLQGELEREIGEIDEALTVLRQHATLRRLNTASNLNKRDSEMLPRGCAA